MLDVSVTCTATPPDGSSRARVDTLNGCRTAAPNTRLWLRWQPLQYSRVRGTSSNAAGGEASAGPPIHRTS